MGNYITNGFKINYPSFSLKLVHFSYSSFPNLPNPIFIALYAYVLFFSFTNLIFTYIFLSPSKPKIKNRPPKIWVITSFSNFIYEKNSKSTSSLLRAFSDRVKLLICPYAAASLSLSNWGKSEALWFDLSTMGLMLVIPSLAVFDEDSADEISKPSWVEFGINGWDRSRVSL